MGSLRWKVSDTMIAKKSELTLTENPSHLSLHNYIAQTPSPHIESRSFHLFELQNI